MTQWLLIRGPDRNAPVLLWLHGGPEPAQMPFLALTAELERGFVVVHWDQRGAGKSNPPDFDPVTMTLEQFLADARDVTALSRERLGGQPMIVLGHSWGTMLGARLVACWPRRISRATSRCVSRWTRCAALALGCLGTVAPDSELVGRAPAVFRDHDLYVRLVQAVEPAGGGMNVSLAATLSRALAASEYRLADYRRWFRGANRGCGAMWAEYLSRDLVAEVLVMPVLLVSGASDMNTTVALVRE